MEVNREKLVEFENWCHKCLFFDKLENEEPCWDCLTETVNIDSHKPVKFKEKVNVRSKDRT